MNLDILNHNFLPYFNGVNDRVLRIIEEKLSVSMRFNENSIEISGKDSEALGQYIYSLINLYQRGIFLKSEEIENGIFQLLENKEFNFDYMLFNNLKLFFRGKELKAKTNSQKNYLEMIEANEITLGIGPAGTGKTFLAVAMAVNKLNNKEVDKIILTRPAVEAGENLGFLPGDLKEKIDPYLRPLYDALFEMLGEEKVNKYLEKNIIEIAPLAYMRGRTLNSSFIILDEAQNTTHMQMKMFLTRFGFGSKAVITGDVTQVDLRKGEESGLIKAAKLLRNIKGIDILEFQDSDVVRNRIVKDIIRAYEKTEEII